MPSAVPALADLSDHQLSQALQDKINNKTKPQGSLGQLEDLALHIGQITGSTEPQLIEPQLVVFAASHGLAAHDISAFAPEVNWQMVKNFLAGGAAVSVFARQNGIALTVADCGVGYDFDADWPVDVARSRLLSCQVPGLENGSQDCLMEPAMTAAQCQQALQNGAELVQKLPGNALLLGEMGIGNTSIAALLLSRLTGCAIERCTGAGTGLDQSGVQRKIAILRQVLARHPTTPTPLDVLASLGGLEIATMVGALLQASCERRVVVVDGFISTAAVLLAHALQPLVLQRCVFSHRSGERGHDVMLQHLGVRPLLDLGLRLGEGSGAALAWPLLRAACAILADMASFASAGVSKRKPLATAVVSSPAAASCFHT